MWHLLLFWLGSNRGGRRAASRRLASCLGKQTVGVGLVTIEVGISEWSCFFESWREFPHFHTTAHAITADYKTGEKQSAKKVRLWILIFLLFYGFCSCLRKSIFELSEPVLLRKISPVWESAVKTHGAVSPWRGELIIFARWESRTKA